MDESLTTETADEKVSRSWKDFLARKDVFSAMQILKMVFYTARRREVRERSVVCVIFVKSLQIAGICCTNQICSIKVLLLESDQEFLSKILSLLAFKRRNEPVTLLMT